MNTYWLSQPIQTELGHRHSVSVQGGTKTVKYGVDARYQSNGGVMKGSGRDRYSLSNTLSYNLGDNKFLARNMFTITQVDQRNSPYGSFSKYVRMNPYYPKTDSLGRLIREIDLWNSRGGEGNGVIRSTVLNPMYESTIGSFDKSEYRSSRTSWRWSITSTPNGACARRSASSGAGLPSTSSFLHLATNITIMKATT